MLGTAADQILIQDVVVNPVSKNVYIAVHRGRGADQSRAEAIPTLASVRLGCTGRRPQAVHRAHRRAVPVFSGEFRAVAAALCAADA